MAFKCYNSLDTNFTSWSFFSWLLKFILSNRDPMIYNRKLFIDKFALVMNRCFFFWSLFSQRLHKSRWLSDLVCFWPLWKWSGLKWMRCPCQASAHCSYLDIYISQNIRLYFGRKFQTNLQAKDINFLIWKFRFIILIFLLFFAEFIKSSAFYILFLLFQTCLNWDLMQKSEFLDQKIDIFDL